MGSIAVSVQPADPIGHRRLWSRCFVGSDGAKKSFVGRAIVRRDESSAVEVDACLFWRRDLNVSTSSSDIRHRARFDDALATLTAGIVPSTHQPMTVPLVTPNSLAMCSGEYLRSMIDSFETV
jgi:hypothetical protein